MKQKTCSTPPRILDFSSAEIGFGPTFRRNGQGPEDDLVTWFLEELPIRLPVRTKATIFREPRLDSGFPDIVIVVWYQAPMTGWNSARRDVGPGELRIMHYLYESGKTDASELHRTFGRGTPTKLRALADAGMARNRGTAWEATSISTSFAIRNIIAVEAKIGSFTRVLHQAFRNTWFATTSCILIPKKPSQQSLCKAKKLGIKIWHKEAAPFDWSDLAPSNQPISYASWLFNEWVWRANAFK